MNITFEIKAKHGTLSESKGGWSKQLNFVAWNSKEGKYDIRDWSEDGEKMSRGVTLTVDEMKALKKVLNDMDI
jgi:hypothetical protein